MTQRNQSRRNRRQTRRTEPNAAYALLGAVLSAIGFALFVFALSCIPGVKTHSDPGGLALCIFIVGTIGAGAFVLGAACAFVGIFGARR